MKMNEGKMNEGKMMKMNEGKGKTGATRPKTNSASEASADPTGSRRVIFGAKQTQNRRFRPKICRFFRANRKNL